MVRIHIYHGRCPIHLMGLHSLLPGEAEYPELLCQRLSAVVATIIESTGAAIIRPLAEKEAQPISMQSREQFNQVKQPRGNLLPQIIPEFGALLDVPWTNAFSRESPRLLTTEERNHLQLQHDAKQLSVTRKWG